MRAAPLLVPLSLAALLAAMPARSQPATPPSDPAAPADAAAPAPFTMTVPTALFTLRDPTAPVPSREDALRVLAFQPSPEGDAELARVALEDPEVPVRFLAVRALESRKLGAGALAQVLAQDTDPRVRVASARALGKLGPQGTLQEPALLAALEDADPAVVDEALKSLRAVGSRAALATLQARGVNSAATDATKGAVKAIRRRAAAAEEQRALAADRSAAAQAPWRTSPLLGKVLRFGGSAYAVGMGAAMGATAGAMLPMAALGKNAVSVWPLAAGLGAAVGGLLGLGYAGLRRFELPVTDAVLVSVHGASGFLSGMGLGLWLGKRSTPMATAATALLGGTVAATASAAASPWMHVRPSMVAAAASGGALGGSATFLAAAAMGVDPADKPEHLLGLVLLGQGVGTILGTGVGAVPLTATDVLLVDLGAAAGAATLAVATVAAGLYSPAKFDARITNGTILGGMALGAGAGALVAALLPTTFENRLTGGLSLEQLPVTLAPALPSPTLSLDTGKVVGATVPLLAGTIR